MRERKTTSAQVILVDDNRDLGESYQEIMELDGVSCVYCETRSKALEVLAETKDPCLVLLDLQMRGIGNEKFKEEVDRLRAQDAGQVKIFGFSSFDMEAEEVKDAKSNFHGFMEKPNDLEAFLTKIKNMLDQLQVEN